MSTGLVPDRPRERLLAYGSERVTTSELLALILGTQELGRGQIIYLADNPLFRGFWQNGKLLFGNAVFLVGQ